MGAELTYLVESLTAQEGKAEQALQWLRRAVEGCAQIPGVQRAWIVQDQRNPHDMTFLLVGDAERFPGILRAINAAAWHQEMVSQRPVMLVEERTRLVIGLALEAEGATPCG